MSINDYSENVPIVAYGERGDNEMQMYYRICPKCGRFVKPDDRVRLPEYQGNDPNATCKKCGRVQMPFAGWGSEEDATD